MKASERAIAKLKLLEGFTPVARNLPGDRADVITGGYGDTSVKLGQVLSEPQADRRLRSKLEQFERYVNVGVKVPLTQSEFDALVLFVYNVGPGDPVRKPPVEGFLTSTLLRKLNSGDRAGAAEEFARWNKSAGKVRQGLINRRAEEKALFLEPASLAV